MSLFRQNEATAAKRRVKVYIFQDDGVTPAPNASTFAAVAASVALTGTHHATLTYITAGIVGNAISIQTVADGSGVGSLTNVGGAYKYHYQSGVSTMANFVTAAAAVFVFSGHTPADILVSAGDTEGPLALVGGIDYGWEISQGTAAFVKALGTVTICTRNAGTPIDGLWQYEATQAELNFLGSEFQLKLEYPGFKTTVVTCEMNDASDFASIGEGSNTYGDLQRLAVSVLAAKVSNFSTSTIVWLSLNGAKTRLTGTVDASGRLTSVIGDLTP